MTNEYKEYLKSKEWSEIRLEIIKTRKKCERCGSKKRLQVHHITYKNIFNEEPNDLELLCSGCHKAEHGIKKPVKKKRVKPKKKRKKTKKETWQSILKKMP
tara:strand:+ start:215 stop:517 length:303 start_codon:yes stop_codon:yes gene_type:complete